MFLNTLLIGLALSQGSPESAALSAQMAESNIPALHDHTPGDGLLFSPTIVTAVFVGMGIFALTLSIAVLVTAKNWQPPKKLAVLIPAAYAAVALAAGLINERYSGPSMVGPTDLAIRNGFAVGLLVYVAGIIIMIPIESWHRRKVAAG